MAVILRSSIPQFSFVKPASSRVFLSLFFLAGFTLGAGSLAAQAPNPSSAANPFWGSITAHPATDETLKLSLDEAVKRGLENNLGLKQAEAGEKALDGEKLEAIQEFLPLIQLSGGTGVYQHNLAALGFNPAVIEQVRFHFPGGVIPAGLSTITRDDLTHGPASVQPDPVLRSRVCRIQGGRGCGTRCQLCQNVGQGRGGAAGGDRVSARSRRGERSGQCARRWNNRINSFSNRPTTAHEAGTVSNLDELRARVQLQAQQQALIAAQNALEKDLILLKREIGSRSRPEGRADRPHARRRAGDADSRGGSRVAYKNRQDYQNLLNQACGVQGDSWRRIAATGCRR
jgi:hypothetical protein